MLARTELGQGTSVGAPHERILEPAYFISIFMTHFQAATTKGLRDRRFSCIPPLS